MQDLLFIDIETDKNGKLDDFGALRGENELHERHIHTFKRWVQRSEVICGHNIINHDIPELKKELGDAPLWGKSTLIPYCGRLCFSHKIRITNW